MSEKNSNSVLERIVKIVGAIRENTEQTETCTLIVTLPDKSALADIDRELYVDSNGTDDGFTPGDEVDVTISGVVIKLKV